ncbi:MAG: F0F1 ATP synthase subunit epsilon [Patescibacteria group bacterium]
MPLHLKMLTPERTIYDADVDQITVATMDGEITILPNHIPLISALKPGEMRVIKQGADIPMAITGGFIEVQPDSRVEVLADAAERIEEIDIERAEVARARAEEYLREKKFETDVEYASLQAQLERALARIRIAKKYRKK